jgi:outer membrane protein OmpA-like peptidoglycan-associated protein
MLIKNILFGTQRKIIPSVFFTGIRNAFIAATVLSVSLSANAEGWDEMDLYIGAGIGQSDLSPQHAKDQGFSIDDHWQTAWKITGGLDVNDYVSVEGYYSDLGSTGLSPDADIGYRMAGADVILHYWAKGEERMQGSIALYAKAGLNHMDTYSSGNVKENDDVRKIFGGLGAEVYLPKKFSVRFEFESYNADASLFSLNLVKRFGFSSKRSSQKEFVAMVEELPETAAGSKIAVLTPVVLDSDSDGLLDDEDQCLDTGKGVKVDEFGCAITESADAQTSKSAQVGTGVIVGKSVMASDIDAAISNVQFGSNSDSLTRASKLELDKIVTLLGAGTVADIEVQAHSDNTGNASYNKNLSQMRADAVVSYLTEKGIAADRLSAIGYGEENPIADNNTKSGRAQNRRVEFSLTTH